jgi:NADPH:quinone reductase-like Zn-dependent oxidoreductase
LLKPKDILVEVKAASLNPIDYKFEGKLKDMISLDLPITIGFDVSGVVIEKSTGVTNFEIGDEIYCRVPQEQMGTIAEFVAVNSELVAKSLLALKKLDYR